MAMAEQQAQRIAGGFAAPADFAALHADRIEAVCRMQAAEGRELTRVWEIGQELEEVRLRLAAVPGPDHSSHPWSGSRLSRSALGLTPTLLLDLTSLRPERRCAWRSTARRRSGGGAARRGR